MWSPLQDNLLSFPSSQKPDLLNWVSFTLFSLLFSLLVDKDEDDESNLCEWWSTSYDQEILTLSLRSFWFIFFLTGFELFFLLYLFFFCGFLCLLSLLPQSPTKEMMKSENLRTPSDTVRCCAVYEKDFRFWSFYDF